MTQPQLIKTYLSDKNHHTVELTAEENWMSNISQPLYYRIRTYDHHLKLIDCASTNYPQVALSEFELQVKAVTDNRHAAI